MKASCLQEAMQRALQITGRVTPGRTSLLITQHTLIRAMDNAIELTATNLEMTVKIRIPATVEQAGALAVPNRLLSDVVGTLPKEVLSMEQPGEGATILRLRCGRVKANITSANADFFPTMPEVAEDNSVVITTEELTKAIRRVAFCAASDHARPVLTGILMELDGDNLTTVAADGFRMGVQQSKLVGPVSRKTTALAPAKTLVEVQKIASSAEGQVEILIPEEGNSIRFRIGIGTDGAAPADIEVTSLILAGTYMEYRTLIPQEMPNRMVLDLSELSRATRRADIFAQDNDHTIRFEMKRKSGGRGQVVITSEARDLGNNRAELETEEMRGEDVSIALNGRYMQDVLSSLNSKRVALETSGRYTPAKMGIPGDDDYVHVMMPIVTLEDR